MQIPCNLCGRVGCRYCRRLSDPAYQSLWGKVYSQQQLEAACLSARGMVPEGDTLTLPTSARNGSVEALGGLTGANPVSAADRPSTGRLGAVTGMRQVIARGFAGRHYHPPPEGEPVGTPLPLPVPANPNSAPYPPPKLRLTIDELAARRRRCGERVRQGLPCEEFDRPAPTPQPAAVSQVGLYAQQEEDTMAGLVQWTYGVTTVPSRRGTTLPRTLASLRASGFPDPVLFVDGIDHHEALSWEKEFSLPVVNRYPALLTFGNWVMALEELYIRSPNIHRYAVFQDDFVCSRNLRAYLDAQPYPDGEGGRPKGYWNLYTFNFYSRRAPRDQTVRREPPKGFYASPTQQGFGAVALVFDRQGVWDVLQDRGNIVTRPSHPTDRAWRAVDGGIVEAMKRVGRYEMVHCPSLVQHIGHKSSMGNPRHQDAESFKGEDFDLLTLLPAEVRP